MLADTPVRELIDETAYCLKESVDLGLVGSEIPPAMAEALDRNVFVFSGCKTYHELQEASQLLRDDTGQIKPFRKFYEEVRDIHPTYNEQYLEAEQEFAVHASQSAAQWAEIEQDGDEYDLQYRTAGDGKVRPEHATLEGITLPPSDPFWTSYMPPNGWRCRCRAVQVRQGKYDRSDNAAAEQLGRKATTSVDSKGRNRAEMFRFNPGKQKVIFPPNHPYYNLSVKAKEMIVKQAAKRVKKDTRVLPLSEYIKGKRVSDDEFKEIMHSYAAMFPENYKGGLKSVVVKRSSSAFMSNGRYSSGGNELTVHSASFTLRGPDGKSVKFNPAIAVKEAFIAIRDGKPLTFNQEYAIESLWHETLHAKAKGFVDYGKRTDMTVMQMETVNQFCARHTYPQFVKSLGGEATAQPEVLKHGYGYGLYLTNFREMLKHYGIDEEQAQADLMPKLLSEPYEEVGKVTIEYLKGKGIKKAKQLMESLRYSSESYEKLLD